MGSLDIPLLFVVILHWVPLTARQYLFLFPWVNGSVFILLQDFSGGFCERWLSLRTGAEQRKFYVASLLHWMVSRLIA